MYWWLRMRNVYLIDNVNIIQLWNTYSIQEQENMNILKV